jgi:hypothetical protein
MRRTTADSPAKGAAPADDDDATTAEFDENPSYTVVGSDSAMEGLGLHDAPTRESKNVALVLAEYEAALDKEKRVPTREVVQIVAAPANRSDELNAAGALGPRDVPGSSEELADAPGTRTGLVLAQFRPRQWWSSPLAVVALGLVIVGAATALYLLSRAAFPLTARG